MEEIIGVPIPQVRESCAEGVTPSMRKAELDYGHFLGVTGNTVALSCGLFNLETRHSMMHMEKDVFEHHETSTSQVAVDGSSEHYKLARKPSFTSTIWL